MNFGSQGPIASLAVTFGAVVGAMLVLWVIGTLRKDVSLVDPFWGLGFVLVGWLAWSWQDSPTGRGSLLCGMTTVWGLRLSLFLLWRNWGHAEDRRYAAMRTHHGERFWWVSLLTVFLLQATILWFVSLPIQAANWTSGWKFPGPLDFLGLAVWATGLFFETVGDWQLARFRADPARRGQVLDSGLWAWTRHPNYFGDACVWWGVYLVALGSGAWWTIGSPLLMTVLLLKVSGVSLLEKDIADRRPDYAAYRARTSPFFPWPPSRRS